MKIMTVLGTRPEIIRLSRVIELLDKHSEHILIHTGQNYDERLDALFFQQLRVRAPDVNLGVRGASFGEQAGEILAGCERMLLKHRPDRLLVLGDTNSGLAAIVARRLGVPVFHMEAGNRCYDDRVPEEVNRRIIDHSSSILLPYTHRSRANLLREGIEGERVFVTGNPILEVIEHYEGEIGQSTALATAGLQPKRFFLVTMHRAENVDRADTLKDLVEALHRLASEHHMPVVCSLHPRTKSKFAKFGVGTGGDGIRFVEPLGFFDFIALERSAFCVLSDSGTVQEETCIFGVPNVTIRNVTERPETIECGSNYLAGTSPNHIARAVRLVTARRGGWTPPAEYLEKNVAEVVVRIVTGHRSGDSAEAEWREGARL